MLFLSRYIALKTQWWLQPGTMRGFISHHWALNCEVQSEIFRMVCRETGCQSQKCIKTDRWYYQVQMDREARVHSAHFSYSMIIMCSIIKTWIMCERGGEAWQITLTTYIFGFSTHLQCILWACSALRSVRIRGWKSRELAFVFISLTTEFLFLEIPRNMK